MADDRSNKNKAIDIALTQIEKQFGKGSIMRLGERIDTTGVQAISTGSISFDAALGIGGFPRGRVVEIFGPESSGKTTIALHAIAQAQKTEGSAAFIDAEHAMDANYAKMLGVNTDELLVSQPDSGEQALEIAEVLVRSSAIDILVVDSVAALVPRAELDGEMGDSLPGLQARLMSQALRKLTAIVSGLPNMIPIFSRIWLMKIMHVLDLETMAVSFLNACDINLACRPGRESPISPSSSALGTRAATESTTSCDVRQFSS